MSENYVRVDPLNDIPATVTTTCDACIKLCNEIIDTLRKQNARYRAALEQYADEKNWTGRIKWLHYTKTDCEYGYEIAQEALAEKEDEVK